MTSSLNYQGSRMFPQDILDDLERRIASLEAATAQASREAPIDMLLFCPKCGAQHIDAPEGRVLWGDEPITEQSYTLLWNNPPHRSHLCHACGNIWRPADVPTNGVKAIQTKGKADTWDFTHPAASPDSLRRDAWISINERLPASHKPVLIAFVASNGVRHVTMGWYAAPKTVNSENFEGEVDDEYDDEKDAYFLREQWVDESFYSEYHHPLENVTLWMPMPEALADPSQQPAQAGTAPPATS